MIAVPNKLARGVKYHTTHFACDERIALYGGQTVGCCCTGHKCEDRQPIEPHYMMVKKGDSAICPIHVRDLTLMDEVECAMCVQDFDAGKTTKIFKRLR